MQRTKGLAFLLVLTLGACAQPGPSYVMVPPDDPQIAARSQFDCETATRIVAPTMYRGRWPNIAAIEDYYARCLHSRGWRQEFVAGQ